MCQYREVFFMTNNLNPGNQNIFSYIEEKKFFLKVDDLGKTDFFLFVFFVNQIKKKRFGSQIHSPDSSLI